MKKIRTNPQLAIAVLLIGGFILAGTILPNAIGDPTVEWTRDAENISESEDIDIDFENGRGSAYVSISGERLDDNGNQVGYVYVSAGASLDAGNQEVTYWANANSGVVGCDENQNPHTGMANALVKVPGNLTAHDLGGEGDSLVNACCTSSMSAYDSNTLGFVGLGNRVLRASAAISVHGHGPRIRVGVIVRGI